MDLRNGQLETQSSNSATVCEYDSIGGITLEQSWKENSRELPSGLMLQLKNQKPPKSITNQKV